MSIYEPQGIFKGDRHGKIKHSIQTIALEAQLDEDPEARVDVNQESIIYHYLTFETTLPLASQSSSTSPDRLPAPEPPDLTDYISPFTWSASRKNTIIFLSCITSMFVCYAAGSYDAAWEQISTQWGVSQTTVYLGITMFTIGFGVAPMILAPFSELNGRKPVFVVTGILFWVSQLSCAVTRSFPGLLVARFFVGVGGSTFSSTIGGVISDIYHKEDRNTPMALFSGSALFGTGLGLLVSGFLAQNLDWRWVFWVQVITCGACILAVITFFKETRGSVILSRKAVILNRWYEAREEFGLVGFEMPLSENSSKCESQRIRWKVKSDEERETVAKMLSISLYRPFHLLCTEPVVFFFSLWASFSWAVLYLTFSIVPLVFTTNHNFTLEQNGAVFAAMCVGSLMSTVISLFQEKVAHRYGKISSTPEGRLYFSCVQSALLPIGLFWFAWTLAPSIHWIAPTMAIGCATMGLFSIYLAVFNYLADTYHRYASSALAAQSFCRNMLAGVFPLIANAMFRRMTFSGASSFLAGISLLLTAVPWILVFFGPKIRARSKFASEIMHQ
ncbi:putative MFS multidrug transporter [Bisporella sp. PMI_857]|nr:putative MFS multidrug transporter [Bisporella sp. PMI_857]